jgi:hypothetical protein
MTGMFILTAVRTSTPAEHNVVLGYSHNDINYRIRDRICLISCEKLSALKNLAGLAQGHCENRYDVESTHAHLIRCIVPELVA